MQFGGALHRVMAKSAMQTLLMDQCTSASTTSRTDTTACSSTPNDCPRLSIILPRYEGEEQLIAIPMSTTMGWVQIPSKLLCHV